MIGGGYSFQLLFILLIMQLWIIIEAYIKHTKLLESLSWDKDLSPLSKETNLERCIRSKKGSMYLIYMDFAYTVHCVLK